MAISENTLKDVKYSFKSWSLTELLTPRTLVMGSVFILLAITFQVMSDGIFLTPRNLTLLLRQGAIVSVVAMGVAIMIIQGEIDLSTGSAVYLCGVVAAILQLQMGLPTLPTVLFTIIAGIALGAWQGVWVVGLGVPSFVVTLAGLLAFRGAGFYMTDAATLAPMSETYAALSGGFVTVPVTYFIMGTIFIVGILAIVFGSNRSNVPALTGRLVILAVVCAIFTWIFVGYKGIPYAVVWVGVCLALLSFLMTRTVFGRNSYLIGSNREAARLSGIEVRKYLLGGFILMGTIYGIAGTLMTARLSASTPTSGLYLELDAIAAAVIGGCSLRGGIGTVFGAVVGAGLLVMIDNGMSVMNISTFIQMMVKGGVLLLALAADAVLNKKK